MRERGLKHTNRQGLKKPILVAPHAGAWIETLENDGEPTTLDVAPHAGAWIETVMLPA